MSVRRAVLLVAGVISLAACGSPTVIDRAKKASLPECSGHSLGKIVNGYFISNLDSKTLWTAYATPEVDTLRITAEGDILYVGVKSKALLEVLFKQNTQQLFLSKLSINGKPQPFPMAETLVSNMCDKANGK